MSWTTPVTDRAASDISNRTAKAFFNVADWTRIDGNSTEIQALILSLSGVSVSLITLTAPTTSHFPTATAINQLIENIERLRAQAYLPPNLLQVLRHDYEPGSGAQAPDYVSVNAWESNQNLMYTLLPRAAGYSVRCGVASVGQPRHWQHRYR